MQSMRPKSSASVGQAPSPDSLFVTALYSTLFHRAATASEVASWTDQLASGVSRTKVVQTLCTSFGADLRTTQIVTLLFKAFFGRLADAPSRAFFTSALTKALLPTVVAMLSSEEYYKAATT